MATYAFILGRKRLLSIAELCATLDIDGTSGNKARIIDIVPEALIAQLPEPLALPQESLNRLGGTISIAEIFSQSKKDNSAIIETVGEFLTNKFQGRKNKLNYGVSLVSMTGKHEQILKKTLKNLKKILTEAGLKSRFINKNFKNPQTAAIHGEKLLQDGAHLQVIEGNHHYFYGNTVALQDIEKYTERDYQRPGRDPHLGMLPPKLAQMMINFAGKTSFTTPPPVHQKSQLLYDPFAGIGTVLTEGLLLGFHVEGSDINAEALTKARKNIDWTMQKYNIIAPQPRLFTKDATQLSKKDLPDPPTLVVTESWLGPAVSQFPPPQNIKITFKIIHETLLRFFHTLKPLVKPGTPVVISLLAYKRQDRYLFLENLPQEISQLGWKIEPLIPHEISKKFGLKVYAREGLIYDRPDQIVCREIWEFINL